MADFLQKFTRIWACLFISLYVYSSPSVAAEPPSSLVIAGHEYEIKLQVNAALAAKLSLNSHDSTQHFRGRILDQADSWVRISRVGQQWQGLASLAGESYVISHTESGLTTGPNDTTLFAEAVSELPHARCGTAHPDSPLHKHSALSLPQAALQFSDLCSTMVDGVCLLAEVEFVFDQQFQSSVEDPAATSNAIINLAEGFYSEALGIEFDTITIEMLQSEVFSATNNAAQLLGGSSGSGAQEDPMSVRALSASGQLAFEKSRPALLHLVSGRQYEGGTAGVAFVGGLCDSHGYASSVSQIIQTQGGAHTALTAIAVAHELGHNFGASHDALDNECSNGFLMAPNLDASVQSFSSCSEAAIRAAIGELTAPEQCFNFPVETSLIADSANPVAASEGESFSSHFDIQVAAAHLSVPQLTLSGSVTAGTGEFSSASLNGAACSVAADGTTYSCVLNNPASSAGASVSMRGEGASVSFRHTLAAVGDEVRERNTHDNTVTESVSLQAAQSQSDNNTNASTGPANTAPTNTAEAASGGGGSSGLWLFGLLVLALFQKAGYRPLSLGSLLVCVSACQTGQVNQAASAAIAPGSAGGHYSMVQQRQCFCHPDYTRPIKVWVRAGEIVSARYDDDDAPVSTAVYNTLKSEEAWRDSILELQKNEQLQLELEYHSDSGRLKSARVDPSPRIADDEFVIRFWDYTAQ